MGTKPCSRKTAKHRLAGLLSEYLLASIAETEQRLNVDKLVGITVSVSLAYSDRVAIVAVIGEELQAEPSQKLLTRFMPLARRRVE